MKSKHFITPLLVGILWFFLNSPAWADSSQYYKQPLTSPAQIKSEKGVLEATISIGYNIQNNAGDQPTGSSPNPRSTIGPDMVSLRNYTVQNVKQGSFTFTVDGAAARKPSSDDNSTWVTDLIGPTLRVKPEDTITLHLIKNLPDDRGSNYSTGTDSCIGKANVSDATCNMTNFHTHGLHDSPANVVKSTGEIVTKHGVDPANTTETDYWVSDDVIDSLLPGGNKWDIKIEIPKNHPAGTFWYHPHQHGATSVALGSGLEGAIIIDDAAPTEPDFNPDTKDKFSGKTVKSLDAILKAAGIKDRLLMFQHLPYESTTKAYGEEGYACKAETPCEVGWTIPIDGKKEFSADFAGQVFTGYTLVNGQTYPLIEMTTGDIERWRLINGGVAEPISLQIVKLSDTGINGDSTSGKKSLDEVLDGLVAPNRVPFIATTKAGNPTDSSNVVIGDIVYNKNNIKDNNGKTIAPTAADRWLADSTNFGDTVPLNIIAYDGITTGRIDNGSATTCPTDNNTQAEYSYYKDCVTLGPGNRVDALIQPPSPGTYLLLKNVNYNYLFNNGAASAEDIVAVLSVTGNNAGTQLPDSGELLAYANQQYYPPNPDIASAKPDYYPSIVKPEIEIASAKSDRYRYHPYEMHFLFLAGKKPTNKEETKLKSINFGMAFTCTEGTGNAEGNCMATDYDSSSANKANNNLDYEAFTESIEPIILTKDELGKWTLKVEFKGATSAHPFHIHTNPFYLKEIKTCTKSGVGGDQTYSNCHSTYPKRWQDTQLVQPNQIVTFRYQPLDYEGSFVFHCHFVDHEDQGMMRWVKVCKEGTQCSTDETYGLLPDFTPENF